LKRFEKLRNTATNEDYIVGIVDSKGPGGSHFQGEEYWTFSFSFYTWYKEDKNVSNTSLYVYKEVEHSKVRELMDKVKKESVIKIRIKCPIENSRVELIDIEETDFYDEILQPYLDEIKREVAYIDDNLGTLVYDKGVEWFSKNMQWCSNYAELVFNTNDVDELKRMIRDYSFVLENNKEWDVKAREFAALKLLDLKNDFWLDEDEAELTHSDFVNRIGLESLSIESDGGLTFWFKDGDIFAGHVIIVKANSNGEFLDAEMAG
jgi:hypothetical protein